MNKLGKITAVIALCSVAVAGCSIASTDPQHVALHYSDGPFSSKQFEYCVGNGTRDTGGAGDDNFYYPSNQRTFKFSTDEGSDFGALNVATADGTVQLVVKGTATFTINTSCEKYTDAQGKVWPGGRLQKFHETIGQKTNAFTTDEDSDTGAGWKDFISTYIKDVIDKALDNEGQKFAWPDLYANAAIRSTWEKDVIDSIPGLVKAQLGDDLITINNILIQQPDVPDQIRSEMLNNQAAILRAKTSETDQAAAKNFPGGITAYLAYQNALAINDAIKQGKVNISVVPQGASIITGGK